MSRRKKTIAIGWRVFAFFWVAASTVYAQPEPVAELPETPFFSPESGRSFRQYFSPDDYRGHVQTWSVVQDGRGIIYVGNNHRVLEYDGAEWRHIPIPNESIARGLAVDADGTVYVGAQGEIGYLEPDSAGGERYVSLTEHLPEDARDFADVWRVVVLSDGVYFQSNRWIMRWDGRGPMRVWRAGTRFRPVSAVRDTLFVSEDGRGLLALAGDTLALVPGGAVFASKPVYAVLPEPDGGLLVGTSDHGLFRRAGRAFAPMPTDADSLLTTGFLYNGVMLPGGMPVFGTIRKGGVILSPEGRLVRRLAPEMGVPGDPILGLFVDREGALWMAQDGGIVRVDFSSPMTFFDGTLGFGSTVDQVIRHRGRLYAATNEGLRRLETQAGGVPHFRPVGGVEGQVWKLVDVGDALVVGAIGGAYVLRDGRAERIRTARHVFTLYRDPDAPDRIFAGLDDGLAVLERRGGRWRDAGRVEGITEEIRSIARTGPHTLWLGTAFRGMIEVDFRDGMDRPPGVFRYGVDDGLPEGRVYLFRLAGRWKVGTLKGLFDFESVPDGAGGRRLRLTPDTTVSAALADPASDFFRMAEDAQGNVWARIGGETGVFLKEPDGRYRWVWDRTPLRRISQSTISLFPEENGVVWIGRGRDLIRYDARRDFTPIPPALAVVRRVVVTGNDSLLYSGYASPDASLPVLDYADRNLRFGYALPVFDDPAATRYQVRLDGFDAGWSEWTAETLKEYTNLPEGDYRFLVRARDVYGRVSEAGTYAFTVLPPWYRTGWAYAGYALLFLGLLYGAARGQREIHRARERKLERQVQERTAEVERQRDQLEKQALRLAELDQIKSRFFANITHEFRTPLTLTIGPLEDLLDVSDLSADDAEQIRLSLRNARRLLRLINQILDVSRLEAGRLHLHARPYDLTAFLRELARAFTPLAERKRIALTFEAGAGPLMLYFDTDQMEKVFGNLLSNALKFTPEGGAVCVTVSEDAGHAVVRVADTGPGIAPDDLAHIFDRFYQTGESASKLQPGTGIGLALVKELVELHGGTIVVESAVGRGSTFAVRLPKGKDHFAPDQLAAAAEETFEAVWEDAEDRLMRYADPPEPDAGAGAPEPDAGDGAPEPDAPDARDDVPLVLLVDDNAELRVFVRRHLEPVYRVAEAEDGAAALALARQCVPDLIVSDVMMPGMDGDALCRAVKADPEIDFVPVILLTARASMEGKLRGLEEGADDYLTKPFEMRELVVRVRNLIEQRRRLRARWAGDGAGIRLTTPDVTPSDETFLRAVLAAIEAGMADETFSVARLAEAVGQSRVSLHRRLKRLSGKTPSEWILTLRLERAAALLSGGAGTVSEVAYGVGFKSVSYFCKCFRERYDVTPARYRATA
ncbi:ATP-binding protein [Rhodocaloribacter sp.]